MLGSLGIPLTDDALGSRLRVHVRARAGTAQRMLCRTQGALVSRPLLTSKVLAMVVPWPECNVGVCRLPLPAPRRHARPFVPACCAAACGTAILRPDIRRPSFGRAWLLSVSAAFPVLADR